MWGSKRSEIKSHSNRLAKFLLRIGLAFVFLYAAISAFINPDAWTGFLPVLLRSYFPAKNLLTMFSIAEVVLALWLLWGRLVRCAAALASLILLGIILANLNVLDLTFRDVGLFFAALALMMM